MEAPLSNWSEAFPAYKEALVNRKDATTALLCIHAALACFGTAHIDIKLAQRYGMDMRALEAEYGWDAVCGTLVWGITMRTGTTMQIGVSELPSRKEIREIANYQKGLVAKAAEGNAPSGDTGGRTLKPPKFR